MSQRKAPWTDFHGTDIHEGDQVRHPDGTAGVVVFIATRARETDQWCVFYNDGSLLRLNLQVGDKGRACVVPRQYQVDDLAAYIRQASDTAHYRMLDELFGRSVNDVDELAALRRDAERYRWARENTIWAEQMFGCHYDDELDQAIDRARGVK